MSKHIFIPTTHGAEDWRGLLADPVKHWRTGFSARTLAYCWESAAGFPPEVDRLFAGSIIPALQAVELLLALPEHKVILPPRSGHPSQNDVFVLAKAGDGRLLAITVEGKVAESFGPTLARWNVEESRGKTRRLAFIQEQLGLEGALPGQICYQLLHRMVSAVVEARRFNAGYAAMIVHSFSPHDAGFGDYQRFLALFGAQAAEPGEAGFLRM